MIELYHDVLVHIKVLDAVVIFGLLVCSLGYVFSSCALCLVVVDMIGLNLL